MWYTVKQTEPKEGRVVAEKSQNRTIAQNKKAYHDYFVDEKYEAGIELFGTEVKSIRNGGINLKDSYCMIEAGEIFAVGVHVSPYEKGNIFNRDPYRVKRLLMHKKEINKLLGQITQKGLTLVPLSVYFKGSKLKMEIGLCRGKKLYDKRDDAARKQAERDIERAHKERY